MSRRDLDLDRTILNVEVVVFSYTTICSSFKWIEPLFVELLNHYLLNYRVHRHTHTHTHPQTERQTHRRT